MGWARPLPWTSRTRRARTQRLLIFSRVASMASGGEQAAGGLFATVWPRRRDAVVTITSRRPPLRRQLRRS
jgi:hypothetical protein